MGIVALSGCSAGEAAAPTPSPSESQAGEARRLGEALIAAPKGMRVVYGPESGAFGSLKATKTGLAAMREATFDKPQCATAGQLDATKAKDAPTAVVSYASAKGSITQALVILPDGMANLPQPLDPACSSYRATVNGTSVTYTTKRIKLPRLGDASQAFQTTANGVQIGSSAVRYRNVLMSLVVIGKVTNLGEQTRQAYARLSQVVK